MIKNMDRPWFKLGLSLVLIIAFGLRFFRLGEVPVSLYWDEAAILVDAKVVAETGQDMHGHSWLQALFPSYGDYKLPVYIWLASLVVKFFGVSPWAVRLPSALAGVATVWLVGLIARQLAGDKKQAKHWQFWSMLVMAISPWSILFSRTAFEGHLAQLFLGCSCYFLLRADQVSSKVKTWWRLVAGAILGLIATYTYFSVRFIWPALVVLVIIFLWSKSSLKAKLIKIVFLMTIFFLGLWPMFKSPFYAASDQIRYSTDSLLSTDTAILVQNQARQLAGNGWLDRVLFHRAWFWLKALAENLSDQLSLNFLFVSGDPNLRHGTGQHGLFFLIFLPIFLIGMYQLAQKRWKVGLFLVGWWLWAQLPAIVPLTTPHALRSLNALIPLSLIISYGLTASWQWLAQNLSKKNSWLGRGLLLALILSSAGGFFYHYLTQYKIDASSSFQDGYAALAEEIVKNRESVSRVLVSGFDDRFYLWLWLTEAYSPTAIQATATDNFRPVRIDKIELNIDQALMRAVDKTDSSLVVGQKTELEAQLQTALAADLIQADQVNKMAEIQGLDGKKEYAVWRVKGTE